MAFFRHFHARTAAASADPLASAASAAAWCRELPGSDPIARQQAVTRVLAEGCTVDADLAPDRMAAVERLDAETAADRGRLITQYVGHAQAAGAAADRVWQSAYDLCHGFVGAYEALFEHASGRARDPAWRDALPRLLARLIHFYGTDAKLRALKGEPWIPAKWMVLHRLYRRAVDLAIARVPAEFPGAEAAQRATVEQEYIAVLLIHQLNTGTLSPGEIDWAAAEVRTWSAGLALDRAAPGDRGFCVDLDGRAGLQRGSDLAGSDLRHLDTAALSRELDRALVRLRARADAAAAPAERALVRREIGILEKLRPALCPDAPALPREPRVKVSASVRVRIGLADICRELVPGEAHDLAFDAPFEGAAAGGSALGAPGGPAANERLWLVDDRSGTGLRIVSPAGEGRAIGLGSLVAVRDPDAPDWALGVARRVTRPMSGRVEIGVEMLAGRVLPVALHAKRQARDDMGFVVDGVDVSTIGERFGALYLPPSARPDHPLDARSLIVGSGEYAEGRQVILVTLHTVYTVALRRVLERQADWTWVTFDVLQRTARD